MIKIDFNFRPFVEMQNKYELTVFYAHGPADTKTQTEFQYELDEVGQLKLDILGLISAKTSGWAIEDVVDSVIELFQEQGIEDPFDTGDNWRDRFYEDDIATGLSAKVIDFELLYFDDAGVKHIVDVLVNGRKIS